MSTSADLVEALERLERALGEFTTAYASWLRDGGDNATLRMLLDQAEQQLDAARAALATAQDALRE